MQKLLVPVLLLTAVALSSSKFLPIMSMKDMTLDNFGQENDNTYSNNNKFQSRDNQDAMFFDVDFGRETSKTPKIDYYVDNTVPESASSYTKSDKYNVEGFRKEQWHNYPRQLDRLNRYFYEHHNNDKRNLDPDDPRDPSGDLVENYDKSHDDEISNEYQIDNELETRKVNKEAEMAAAVINPLLIFRIHLACLNRGNHLPSDLVIDKLKEMSDDNTLIKPENPNENQIKVKREEKIDFESDAQASVSNRPVSKRLFALWSRLKSFTPKGHELHHRRRLYALYGQESQGAGAGVGGGGGGNSVLTAETRATFMRPPGSPLRWG